eukprot:gb/GFBE01070369.1/.p1 GENE.gb/GFBE01070369.1/~~gb/GFBE01070369.1/.p1  ORF type:complete len:370 (+),score=67.69 gb/GFBE01070369.1/:1-1110(+)
MTCAHTGPMFVPLPPGLESLCSQYENAVRAPCKISLSAELSRYAQLGALLGPPPGLEMPAAPLNVPGNFLAAFAKENPTAAAAIAACFAPPECPPRMPLQVQFPEEIVQKTSEEVVAAPFGKETAAASTQAPWGLQECGDAELEAVLEPVLRDILGRGKGKGGSDGNCIRWWTRPQAPLLCPLARFPICLLPYPPFKLRVDPKHASPHRLVDGKFLAMQCIVTGRFTACGRDLQSSDISALDDYVHRCKLGQYRPGRAAALAKEANNAPTAEQRAKAAQELERFVVAARAELGKLRRIQENRLLQINKVLPAHAQAALKGPAPVVADRDSSPASPSKGAAGRGRVSSSGSTCTRTSTCSVASDISSFSD